MRTHDRPRAKGDEQAEAHRARSEQDVPLREELERFEGMQDFLIAIGHIRFPTDDLPPEYEPSLEQNRVAFARYELLERLNPRVTLYHQLDRDTMELIRDPSDPNVVTILPGTIHQFTGQGIYFGLHEPFDWVHEEVRGEITGETFVLKDVPISRLKPSVSGVSRRPMASLMVRALRGRVHFDAPETIHGTQHVRDFNNPQDRRWVEKVKVFDTQRPYAWHEMQPGLRYYTFDESNYDDPANDTWWKIAGEYMGVPHNRPILSEQQIQFLDEALGIVDVERVTGDDDVGEPYDRVYVRSTSPLLVGAAASMVDATEIVFGRPGSEGARRVAERKHIARMK